MKKRKLNYRFHNPNTAEVTADYLLKILIEANASKVEQAIQEAANELPEKMKMCIRDSIKLVLNETRTIRWEKYCWYHSRELRKIW